MLKEVYVRMSEDRLELKKNLLKTLLAPVFDNSALSGGTDGGDNVNNSVKELLEAAIDAKVDEASGERQSQRTICIGKRYFISGEMDFCKNSARHCHQHCDGFRRHDWPGSICCL